MTPEQFCYWLQGRAELQPDNAPTADEWKSICEHLGTVFHKVTPQIGHIVKDGPDHHIQSPTIGQPDWMRWRAECSTGGIQGGHAIAIC